MEGERPKLWAAVLHVGPRLSRSDEISHTCSATMRCAAILAAPGRGSAEPPCAVAETRRRPLRSSASAARDEISPAARRAVLSATSPA